MHSNSQTNKQKQKINKILNQEIRKKSDQKPRTESAFETDLFSKDFWGDCERTHASYLDANCLLLHMNWKKEKNGSAIKNALKIEGETCLSTINKPMREICISGLEIVEEVKESAGKGWRFIFQFVLPFFFVALLVPLLGRSCRIRRYFFFSLLNCLFELRRRNFV